MYCFSQTDNALQGFSLTTSYHEKLHDIIKDSIRYEKSGSFVFKKVKYR
jgi:hypothetical protein